MPKRTLAIISLAAGIFFSAAILKADTPPKIEESTPAADKAAVSAASSDADKWAATAKPAPAPKPLTPDASTPSSAANTKPVVQPPAAVPAPAPPAPAPVAAPPKASAPPVAHRSDLNEMKGKLESKSSDPQTLRLIVDGGFNVEFTYDNKTAMINGGSPITIDDLSYGDELVIRYSGKELYAVELDRVSKAPRPPE